MVLDLELFREDKGGNPAAVRENQTKRFKDVALVDAVVAHDTRWRQLRHLADTWNKLKNLCSKEVGDRMKRKEPLGDEAAVLPAEIEKNLADTTIDTLKPLTINQIKKVLKNDTFLIFMSFFLSFEKYKFVI